MPATRTKSDVTIPVALAAAVPVLVVRFGLVYLRMKVRRRRGVRTFRKALLAVGMSPKAVAELCAEYESYGRLRSILPEGLSLRSFRSWD